MARNSGGGGQPLTKQGLKRLTSAARRQEARRRGQSTPPLSPRLRDDSTASSQVKARRGPPLQQEDAERAARDLDALWDQINAEDGWYQPDLAVGDGFKFDPHGPSRCLALPPELPADASGQEPRRPTSPIVPQTAQIEGPTAIDPTTEVAPVTAPAVTPRSANEQPYTAAEGGGSVPVPTGITAVGLELIRRRGSRPPIVPKSPAMRQQRSYYKASARPTGDPEGQPPRLKPQNPRSPQDPRFPPNFPTYRATRSLNEAAAYLANASYFVSVGGPPLADIKYGIIAVPVGEEGVLFGPQPDHVVSQAFLDAVADANREYFNEEVSLHDPDNDSDEFVRRRFEGDHTSEPSVSNFRRVELTPPRVVDKDKEEVEREEEEEEEAEKRLMQEVAEAKRKKGPARRTTRAVKTAKTGVTASGSQRVTKLRTSPRKRETARVTRASKR